jgi:hypothetical protein
LCRLQLKAEGGEHPCANHIGHHYGTGGDQRYFMWLICFYAESCERLR